MKNQQKSQAFFERAKKVLPGGVNSPVRAFLAVGGDPLFIESARGAYVTDADGNVYLDYVGSWGPMILGHSHPKVLSAVQQAVENGLSFGAPTQAEVRLAELMSAYVPNLEMVRFVNSGTESVMSALRAARGATGRERIVKFEGCYHGHSDSMLVKAGSGALTSGAPSSSGVPTGAAGDTLVARYNDLASVRALLKNRDVAAVIVEPVAANMGVVPPQDGFLQGLRELCDEFGSLLIFDEVITGFRLARGGAQEYYGVRADLVTFGKIIGGGMPVGAYGGRRDVMSLVAPLGTVYQAGTLSGNPVAMAAGEAMLLELADDGVYDRLEVLGRRMEEGIRTILQQTGIQALVTRVGSLLCLFFGIDRADSYDSVRAADAAAYARYFHGMLDRGFYLAPAQFEAMFLSAALTDEDLDATLGAIREVLTQMKNA
ncbi:Glutamate-1-semialdehyde aminotransferase [Clostridiaceae bacterium JG1575]|nr:Glutamate-1-semialdehyde aminotransferase [Clostridiaceae bacterium JG1575]